MFLISVLVHNLFFYVCDQQFTPIKTIKTIFFPYHQAEGTVHLHMDERLVN